jgi:hypothetical protein
MPVFVPNPGAHERHERDPQFRKGLAFTTGAVAQHVQQAAEPFRFTGNYIGRVGTARGRYVLVEKHFAHIHEYGSVNNVPQRNVLRGVRAAGLRFEDDRAALS